MTLKRPHLFGRRDRRSPDMRPKLLHHIIVAASARTLRHLGAVELPALLHRAFVFVVVSSFALKKVCLPHTSTLLRFSFGRRHIFPPPSYYLSAWFRSTNNYFVSLPSHSCIQASLTLNSHIHCSLIVIVMPFLYTDDVVYFVFSVPAPFIYP